ncbi:hypothetical protein ACWGOQ_0001465 [Aquimarina sp. M1]
MKKIKLKTLMIPLLILVFYSCELEETNEAIDFDQTTVEAPENFVENQPKASIIATIQNDGMEYTFIEIENENKNDYDIFLKGKVYDYEKLTDIDWMRDIEGRNPFETFVAITDDNISIPETLAKLGGLEAVKASGRTIENAKTAIYISDPNFEQIKQKSSACYNESESTFRNQRCLVPLSSNPDYIEFCDSGIWTSHTRNSTFGGNWRKLNEAFTWTNVICGSTSVKFYRHKGSWQLRKEVQLDSGIWYSSYWTVTITQQNPWLPFSPEIRTGSRLRVKRNQNTSNNSFRAYTRFRKKLYN